MEFNRDTKMAEVAKMKEAEKAMAANIDKIMDAGLDKERQGCGGGCFPWLFRRSGRSRVAQEQAFEVAVFGQGATSANAANARLEKAATQMENHAEQLYAKAGASRSKAKAMMAQGKKAEAMAALKRCKALEKQAEVAASTHAAIEQQKDMLESSALQREVATALSASIATTKQKTKGLLEKAENAVDSSAELRDAVDDISEVMGGLTTNDHFDEDDLLEELEQLAAQDSDSETAAPEPMASTALPAVEPQAIVVGIDPALYPKAPANSTKATRRKTREIKQQLLAADSAAEH
tara:strand:- start:25508 stop:26386 length:879 start_codon:yes stop_codon:yes gene_type:complete